MDVHFLVGSLVHIGVLFDRADQIGDAASGIFDLIEQGDDGERSGDAGEEVGPRLSGELLVHPVEPGGLAAGIHQGGRQVPGARDPVTQQARRDGLLAIAAFEGIHGRRCS